MGPFGIYIQKIIVSVLHKFNKNTAKIMKKLKPELKYHYENMPMQYTEIFKVVKNENFRFSSKHRLWVHVRTASVRRF